MSVLVLLVLLAPLGVWSQDDQSQAIAALFSNSSNLIEVTQKPDESFGALEKCGEGSGANKEKCVVYHLCDRATNTIVEPEDENPNTDGFGLIDIRFGQSKCSHYMDVCCKIPDRKTESSTSPRPSSTSTTSSTIQDEIISYCGRRNDLGLDFKITGNNDHEAEYGEFPWMVALFKKNPQDNKEDSKAFCGGSLITPQVVLTGAHCIAKYKSYDIKIRAGEWDMQTEKERLPYQERNVKEFIIHPKFNAQLVYNDVALIILESPVKAAENIGTICLPPQGQINLSRECYTTGWGKRIFGKEGQYQMILKKTELPIVPFAQCQDLLRNTRLGKLYKLDSSFICAGGQEGKDACTGDGGGPLVCPDPQNPRRYFQTGIVSWGIGCGVRDVPGVYADVGKFRNWIDQHLEDLNFDTKPYTI